MSHNFAVVYKLSRHALESRKESAVESDLIPFRIPIDHVFYTIKYQPWVRCPSRSLLQNLKRPRFRDYNAFHDGRGHLIGIIAPSDN